MPQQIVTETHEETKEVLTSPEKVVKTTTKIVPPPVDEEHPQEAYKTKKTIFRTYQVLWYILGTIEVLLVFRVLLKLVGANQASGFASFIYAISDPFAKPFFGVVPGSAAGGSLLEWSTLIAMAVYWVIVWGIIELFQLVKSVNQDEVEQTVDSV